MKELELKNVELLLSFIYKYIYFTIFRDGRILGILETSRSIGDVYFKRKGVISTPTITKYHLKNHDMYLFFSYFIVF